MNDEHFMRLAIEEARKHLKDGGGPFGACIVKDGKVVACAHNTVYLSCDSTAHAEINAIREACQKLKTIDLSDCVIYSTTEPCPMCFSAIHWAKIKKIVYGTHISDAKAAGLNEMSVSNETLNGLSGDKIELVRNILRDEAILLFKEWGDANGKKY
jgi:guanine deaminase